MMTPALGREREREGGTHAVVCVGQEPPPAVCLAPPSSSTHQMPSHMVPLTILFLTQR